MEISSQSKQLLVALAIKNRGDARALRRSIVAKERLKDEEIAKYLKECKDQVLTVFDEAYPRFLEQIYPMPVVLFYRGNINLIRDMDSCIGIVGSRETNDYSKTKTRALASSLAKRGFTIISGLARGIDTVALEAALPYGKAVAVIGNGTRYYYPAENEELQNQIAKYGLVLSEYPTFFPPAQWQFVARNRLIAALSTLVVVSDARRQSGALITATLASKYGHDVGAFPHDDDGDNGCNMIIKDGAFLIEDEEDVATILGSKGAPFFAKK